MLAVSFPATAFATNCYVLAAEPGQECLIVDPGFGTVDVLTEVIAQYGLRPAAVLLTHGHLDHTYAVTPVCGGTTAAYIHQDDRYRLVDPITLLEPELRAALAQQFGPEFRWKEPEDVVEVTDRQTLHLAGLDVQISHAPGHTEGSVMFGLPGVPDGVDDQVGVASTVLTGDVVFAGSVGRTDLDGGSAEAMHRSLRDVVLPLPDTSLLLPGHGPATTMARERATNPYLQGLT